MTPSAAPPCGGCGRARAVYEVPAGRNFTVGDITIGGKPIEFGAQIADFITIKLMAVARRLGRSTAQPQTACAEPPPRDEFTEGAFSPGALAAHGCLGTHPDQASRSTRLS
jgi:hypothetical protein